MVMALMHEINPESLRLYLGGAKFALYSKGGRAGTLEILIVWWAELVAGSTPRR